MCPFQKSISGSNWGRNSGTKLCQLNCHPVRAASFPLGTTNPKAFSSLPPTAQFSGCATTTKALFFEKVHLLLSVVSRIGVEGGGSEGGMRNVAE